MSDELRKAQDDLHVAWCPWCGFRQACWTMSQLRKITKKYHSVWGESRKCEHRAIALEYRLVRPEGSPPDTSEEFPHWVLERRRKLGLDV